MIFIVELTNVIIIKKKNNKKLIIEDKNIKVIDITGKLNSYVSLDEFMKRTEFLEK